MARGFASAGAFRAWLEENHATARELLVRCFKTHARERGMTYSEALDEALCFGWIDGVRHGLDAISFSVRFSPRKPKSYWSAVNIRRAEALLSAGRMHAAGREAFAKRDSTPKGRYSFEAKPKVLAPAYVRELKAHPPAYERFKARPPGYRRTTAFWVMSARRPETRAKRLAQLIESLVRGAAIAPLTRTPK